MIMNEKDKLDILIYNICNDGCSKQIKIEKLSMIASDFNIAIDDLFKRYNWLRDMKIDPNKIHLEENHHQIYKIFDEYNKMLNKNNIEYYYTSGILSYLLVDRKLERYHHDLDVFVNMDDLTKLEQVCNDYNFSFERKLGDREDGTKRIMLKMYYKDIIDIPITVFMYVREKDNSIIQKDYFIDKNGQSYIEYIYNSPSISELSFSSYPKFHNGIKYYSITPEALFLCKSENRPKDIYDCAVFKHIIDINKLKKLEESFKNNLPNVIINAEDDEYSNYIFENNTIKKVLVKSDRL